MENERTNGDSILENVDGIGDTSSTDSGATAGDEINSEYTTREETIETYAEAKAINNLPRGCNVFYGSYIDNYDGTTRTRYYFDSYGQLIPSIRTTNNNRPTGSQCMTEMPMSHNMDMGIIVAEAAAAIAIYLAVKFVVGRLIK